MTVLFAFLHHLAAFTLVAAIAIEFVLLRGELTLWTARRLQVTDAMLGGAATVLLVRRARARVLVREGRGLLLPQSRVS